MRGHRLPEYPKGDRFRCPCGGLVVAGEVGDGEWEAACDEGCGVIDIAMGRTGKACLDDYWDQLRDSRRMTT